MKITKRIVVAAMAMVMVVGLNATKVKPNTNVCIDPPITRLMIDPPITR